jgi:hypothetical protein
MGNVEAKDALGKCVRGPDASTTASSEQAAGDDHQLEIRALIIKKSFIARFLLAR